MRWPVRRGVIFWIPDRAVTLPPTPEDKRTHHKQRPYVVLSGNTANTDSSWGLVFGAPLTTGDELHSEWDIKLPRGTANLPEDCWTMLTLAQAVPKIRLRDGIGQLAPAVVDQIDANFGRYLGYI